MTQEQWTAVDRYITDSCVPSDPALDAALKAAADANLPSIQVSQPQGKFLAVLAGAIGARKILEIGTLGAYSTIWMARMLPPGGKLISLEYDPKHAEVSRANIAQAGLSDVVEVRLGAALDTLPQIDAEGHAPFDMVFIDADKINNAAYFDWALKLTRPGSLIFTDNIARSGAVVDANSTDESVIGVRRFFERISNEPRVMTTAMQTVGSKGYDGFALSLVLR
jgi:predicted O-methyltransferase YrrM